MKKIGGAWLLVALLPTLLTGIVLDPTRIDAGNFAVTWSAFAQERDGVPLALAVYVTFAIASLAAAVWLRRTLGSVWPAVGLAASAALAVVTALAGATLYVLSGDLRTIADPAALDLARAAELVRTLSLTTALVLAAGSLIGAGVTVQRSLHGTPWLYSLPAASALLLLCIPIGWATVGAATFIVPSAFLLLIWLVVVSAGSARRARTTATTARNAV